MSEYEQVIDEIVKHGVVVKVDKIVDDNYVTGEGRYDGCVVKLDFSEHDKVFADRIVELLKKNDNLVKMINELQLEKVHIDCELYDAKQRISELEYKIGDRDEINRCLREQIAELQNKEKIELPELPFDPLDTANYLINATYERETNGIERAFQNLPEKVNSDRYTVDELEQIAEHLLIYCRHNKE